MTITLEDLSYYQYDGLKSKSADHARRILEAQGFENSPDTIAVVSNGGTMGSAYTPTEEKITATTYNVAAAHMQDLQERFGLGPESFTALSLIALDSRLVQPIDAETLLDVLNTIENEIILLTCGTYMLPIIGEIVDEHVKGQKIIGLTGSMLTTMHKNDDVDFNLGGLFATATALHKLDLHRRTDKPLTFINFHGQTYFRDEFSKLNFHPDGEKDFSFIDGRKVTIHPIEEGQLKA